MNGQKLIIGLVIWMMLISSVLLNAIAQLLLKAVIICLMRRSLPNDSLCIVFQPLVLAV
jgi:hypothetical protein